MTQTFVDPKALQATNESLYIANHYGTCRFGKGCFCLKPGYHWLGLGCRHWQPIRKASFAKMLSSLRNPGRITTES